MRVARVDYGIRKAVVRGLFGVNATESASESASESAAESAAESARSAALDKIETWLLNHIEQMEEWK
jgi:CBS domain containing-hemolysin-like protein